MEEINAEPKEIEIKLKKKKSAWTNFLPHPKGRTP